MDWSLALLSPSEQTLFARHDRHAEATRRAIRAWGLEVLCRDPKFYSSSLTAALAPEGHDADAFRAAALAHFDISLGTGLGKFAGRAFRIGHLGECNALTLMGALSGVEMGLSAAGVPHRAGGVDAAMKSLEGPTESNSPAHLKVVTT